MSIAEMSQELPALQPDQDDQPLSQRVYQAMLSAIISGQLKPGEVVNEIRLAQELGVSRTPVHTAIRELVKDGLITQEANRRPVVARFSVMSIWFYAMRRVFPLHWRTNRFLAWPSGRAVVLKR